VQTSRPDAPFEVHCARCRVTFPLGTRRCIHCGGRTGPTREAPTARLAAALDDEDGGGGSAFEVDPAQLGPPQRFSPLTLLWIALVVGGYAMRTCTGS
jgi:hypothetical protein